MTLEEYNQRLVRLSKEAERRSIAEMWRIRADKSLPERIGKTGLGALLRSERIRKAMVRRAVEPLIGNRPLLGYGSEQLVTHEDDGPVLKFLYGSVHKHARAAQDEATELQSGSDTCQDYLGGEYWLSTTFGVSSTGEGRFVVTARQERLDDPILYKTIADVPPGQETQAIAQRVLALHDDTGLYPDFIGLDNVARRSDTGRLCQIDTIPVPIEAQSKVLKETHRTIAEEIEHRLSAWQQV